MDFVHESLAKGALCYVVKPRLTSDLVPAIEEALVPLCLLCPSLGYA